ncbi:MAG: argininosuccinate lyase [Bacteroidota bacterium]|nr:argininosuccinate lyase [Bacteroidota bacterium]
MKLWDKGTSVNEWIERFTVGRDREMDLYLAEFDVLGTIAHITMLETIGLIGKDELPVLKKELVAIYNEVKAGNFVIEDGIEDVHSQVELMLTRKLGDIGKKVHSGRSRNDQVLVDCKLFIRSEIQKTVESVNHLFDALIEQSEKYKSVLIPGYTHLQVAMPSSFGLWFGAYAESLADDLLLLQTAYRIANQNPLGSAAGYGSSFPLNRTLTTQLLGFDDLSYNVVYAQMGRGKTEKITAFALSSVAATLSRMAMDICLYMSQNFAFLGLPDEFTTGSSIMPHKKNPDVFELIRAKSNKVQALPNDLTLMLANLPSGYFRDMQILKEIIFPAFAELRDCIDIAAFMMDKLKINQNILDDERYKYLFSVDELNKLVLQGVPFRDAYKIVGKDINEGKFNPEKKVEHTHEGSIGNLCNDKIRDKFVRCLGEFGFEKTNETIDQLLK